MQRGIFLSVDSIACMVIVCAIAVAAVSSAPHAGCGYERLAVVQKQHDLLRVWMHERAHDSAEMGRDAEFVLHGIAFRLRVDSEEVLHGKPQAGAGVSVVSTAYPVNGKSVSVELIAYC